MVIQLLYFNDCDYESVDHVLWEYLTYYSNIRNIFISSLNEAKCKCILASVLGNIGVIYLFNLTYYGLPGYSWSI